MILINQLHMAYGQKLLFFDVNLTLSSGKHYALVGANGAGKSTFFKLLTGEEEAVGGNVSIPKEASVGWLKQDQFKYENTVILDIVLQGKTALWEALLAKEKLLQAEHWDEKITHRFSKLEETITSLGGYSAESFAAKLLIGLGIAESYHKKPLSALSGGFKLRVLLAQALFQSPDILLLDEPTNHLDILSIRWLEKYLKNEFRGLVVFISHDVSFIDRLADYILDIDYGEIREYHAPYRRFLEEKQVIEAQRLLERVNAEQKIAAMQKFVDRFQAGTRARQAQSRVKMIEKIELPDIKQTSRMSPHFSFKVAAPSAKSVLKVHALHKAFAEKKLFSNVSFEILRSEHVAIIGENGIGKSTLIKILLGHLAASEGQYEWGSSAAISYFSQDHHDLLNEHASVLTWLNHQVGQVSEQQVRKTLGQVLFRKDEVEKDILSLSGGEAARLLLAKMILEPSNILVLDEPTNHLDIEAKDALAKALSQYQGTVLFVSHDRDFINKIANRILYISHQQALIDFKGTFSVFEEKHDEL